MTSPVRFVHIREGDFDYFGKQGRLAEPTDAELLAFQKLKPLIEGASIGGMPSGLNRAWQLAESLNVGQWCNVPDIGPEKCTDLIEALYTDLHRAGAELPKCLQELISLFSEAVPGNVRFKALRAATGIVERMLYSNGRTGLFVLPEPYLTMVLWVLSGYREGFLDRDWTTFGEVTRVEMGLDSNYFACTSEFAL